MVISLTVTSVAPWLFTAMPAGAVPWPTPRTRTPEPGVASAAAAAPTTSVTAVANANVAALMGVHSSASLVISAPLSWEPPNSPASAGTIRPKSADRGRDRAHQRDAGSGEQGRVDRVVQRLRLERRRRAREHRGEDRARQSDAQDHPGVARA